MKRIWSLIPFFVLIHFFVLTITQFTAWPEMTLWPYLLLHGWLPYKDIAIAHTPILFTTLAFWYSVVGLGIMQLKIFTWLIIFLTSFVIYKTAIKIGINGYVSVFVYLLLNYIFEGNGLWFDLALSFLAITLYYFLTRKKYRIAGIISALMFLTKQTAVWFLPIILFRFILKKVDLEKIKNFIIFAFFTLVFFIVILFSIGILDDFYRWAINFGIFILPKSVGQIELPTLKEFLINFLPISIILIPFFIRSKQRDLHLWALAGLMGIFPRFELFHFQPALPFVALIVADLSTHTSKEKTRSLLSLALFLYIFLVTMFYTRKVINNVNLPDRFAEPDILEVSQFIDDNTKDNSTIYVINDWDDIYAFSHTLPATEPWIPHLPWYIGLEGVEKEMLTDLENEMPKFIVQRPFEESGLGSFKPGLITNFISDNYTYLATIEGHIILIRK